MTAPILIVEDEVALAVVASQYLQREGYATVMIHDGDQAMEWLRTHQPLLVVLDRMLPGTDGLTLCRELRKTSDVPIIIDRKSTRLNSSHVAISYAVFCLKKKKDRQRPV